MLRGWITNNNTDHIAVNATGHGDVHITLQLNNEDKDSVTVRFEKQTVETIVALLELARTYDR